MSVSDAWFSNQVAPDGDIEDGCHPDEAQALKDYHHHKTTAKQAAHAISRPIEDGEDPHNLLYRLWGLLTDALLEWPVLVTPALIDLMDAIQRLPEPDLTGGHSTKTTVGHRYLWRELPGFGHQWADAFWRSVQSQSTAPEEERAQLRSLHIKRANIEARLAVADVGAVPLDWGYDCICDALESSNAVLDFEVPAAAEWIAIAGIRLYSAATAAAGENLEKQSWALRKERDLLSGPDPGLMTRERWSFWENRLGQLLDQPKETHDAARKALQDMKDQRYSQQ